MENRKVILHYHLFKNAGTSLDSSLKSNFQENEWVEKEFPANKKNNERELANWIAQEEDAKCFSTHTGFLPTPELSGTEVFPIIFLRNPIDRIASAYAFESKQGGDSFGAVLARNTDIGGYIETRLAINNDRQCKNFHTHRLAMMYDVTEGDEITRAKKAVSNIAFFGLVEQFTSSVSLLEKLLQEYGFESFELKSEKKNVSQKASYSLEQKLEKLKNSIGCEMYEKVTSENSDDIELYEHACVEFDKRLSAVLNK